MVLPIRDKPREELYEPGRLWGFQVCVREMHPSAR